MDLPKILIVDDREFDRILYKEYLDDTNYHFRELNDGEGIIDQLKEDKPELILLDWQMPRQGGLETLKMIKKNNSFKDIPIIIITGLQDEKVLEEAFDYGSVDFLNKPVSKIELSSRVMNVLKLVEAQRTLLTQKRELLDLNQIIKNQKSELEKSLALKSQLLETSVVEFEKGMKEKNRKVVSMEVGNSKITNQFKEIKKMVAEAYGELKSENESSGVLRRLRTIERQIEYLNVDDDSWTDFKSAFESIESEFFSKLTQINPKLTSLDLKHCAYIRMNLDNYEVSKILNVEMKSLQMTRYRLKKKLNLNEEIHLREFILSV